MSLGPDIRVMLCCNDPDNGQFCGRLDGIEVGGMRFGPVADPGPRLAFFEPKCGVTEIRIAGKRFPVSGHGMWVGNWCWDAVQMPPSAVIDLLNWPRFRRFFSLEEAEERLFNRWQSRIRWTHEDASLIRRSELW